MSDDKTEDKQVADYAHPEKTARMQVIRRDRRKAGFAEVTVWVPEEYVRFARDWAWKLIDRVGRNFPHRAPDATARRERKRTK
ncbi:hypothetical protein [Ruegeria jejuensis]|uniref:hypothetical protein n=1 Tax=Ruegeria jejuensis TaxID=3233338 RepID=UPI00355C30C2